MACMCTVPHECGGKWAWMEGGSEKTTSGENTGWDKAWHTGGAGRAIVWPDHRQQGDRTGGEGGMSVGPDHLGLVDLSVFNFFILYSKSHRNYGWIFFQLFLLVGG